MKQPHICLDETLGVRYAILPGDPARLDRIAQQLEGVRELAALGFSCVVLSRELPREEIAYICRNSPVRIEVFVHGAL